MHELDNLMWPLERLGETIAALARACRLSSHMLDTPHLPTMVIADPEQLGTWIKAIARHVEIEAEEITLTYDQVTVFLGQTGPVILKRSSCQTMSDGDRPSFFAVLGGHRGRTRVLGPDGTVVRVPADRIRQAMCHRLELPYIAGIDQILEVSGVPSRDHAKAHAAMLRAQVDRQSIRGAWALRLPVVAPSGKLLRQASVPKAIVSLVSVHALQYGLWIVAWWLIGSRALQGHIDQVWLLTWALLLLTIIPFRLLSTWLQGRIAIRLGGLLKQRLLAGALNLVPDNIRHQGIGQLLGRVLEADTIETLALNGGFFGLVALIELAFAIAILGSGAGGWLHALLLCGWLLTIGGISWFYVSRRQGWTLMRRAMTYDLVERMVGHRTRLAQEPHTTWHQSEDRAIGQYLRSAQPMDATMAYIHSPPVLRCSQQFSF